MVREATSTQTGQDESVIDYAKEVHVSVKHEIVSRSRMDGLQRVVLGFD